MTQQQEWEKWVRVLANSENPRDIDLLVVKIEILIDEEIQKAKEEERGKIKEIVESLVMEKGIWSETELSFRSAGYNQSLTDLTNNLTEK